MNVSNLSGKMVVVTGAASGIGRETALEFARRGADLAICDLNEEGLEDFSKELEAMGRKVIRQKVDVASDDDMARFSAAVHAEVGAVDILMNNAGVGLGGGFLHTSLEDWDWVIGINLKGVEAGPRLVPGKSFGGMVSHQVSVTENGEVDDELVGWLRAAYEQA